MVGIEVTLDQAGLLRSCRVKGHAGAGKGLFRRGADPVCAAVSILVRTALRTLAGRRGIELRGGAPDRGLLWMEADYTAEGRDFLAAAGAFLIEGLKSVSEDYPGYCGIIIEDPSPGGAGV
ncbi:MAG: ribosomal-processing cysteine protease Prp [Treponema sp.]|nr:ribosomal-processing cysteine protease Prp [Treponema sp.]